jgi:acyl-CoA synthetase (AMP-forming)/AMP-acid ligase II
VDDVLRQGRQCLAGRRRANPERELGDLDRLKHFASRELPRYMQPVRYEQKKALARTSSGKHDARALAAPAMRAPATKIR